MIKKKKIVDNFNFISKSFFFFFSIEKSCISSYIIATFLSRRQRFLKGLKNMVIDSQMFKFIVSGRRSISNSYRVGEISGLTDAFS